MDVHGILKSFSAKGYLIKNDKVPDPITGLGGGIGTIIHVDYVISYYDAMELVENRIKAGDASVLVVSEEPKISWKFADKDGELWNIMAVTPTESNGIEMMYTLHVRK